MSRSPGEINRDRIFDYVTNNWPVTTGEIAQALGITPSAVGRHLGTLVRERKVAWRGGTWMPRTRIGRT